MRCKAIVTGGDCHPCGPIEASTSGSTGGRTGQAIEVAGAAEAGLAT
jgi:hypothetical protein